MDIDLDYVQRGKSFDVSIIEGHLDLLSRIGASVGLKAYDRRRADERSSEKLRMIFEFESNFSRDIGTVKLDIGYLMKTTVFPPRRVTMKQMTRYDGFAGLQFPIADLCELWAGKAVALVYKTSKDPRPSEVSDLYSMQIARHLFDVSRFERQLQEGRLAVDDRQLRKAFIVKAVARVKDLYYLGGEGLRRCPERQVKAELDPYLRQEENRKTHSVRPSLDEMKKASKKFMHRVSSNAWTKKEERFVESFQKEGRYKPELLFEKGSKEDAFLSNNTYLTQSAAMNGSGH